MAPDIRIAVKCTLAVGSQSDRSVATVQTHMVAVSMHSGNSHSGSMHMGLPVHSQLDVLIAHILPSHIEASTSFVQAGHGSVGCTAAQASVLPAKHNLLVHIQAAQGKSVIVGNCFVQVLLAHTAFGTVAHPGTLPANIPVAAGSGCRDRGSFVGVAVAVVEAAARCRNGCKTFLSLPSLSLIPWKLAPDKARSQAQDQEQECSRGLEIMYPWRLLTSGFAANSDAASLHDTLHRLFPP